MLSIIIPTYNEEEYLPLLLSSIKLQSYKNYEIIVADNNSKDNTTNIARAYNAKVVPGGLPGAGRNSGASHAEGKILLFLDADVILSDESFLQDIMDEFHSRKLGVATCQILPLSHKSWDAVMHQAYNVFIRASERFVPHAPGFCILVKNSIHHKINGFDELIKLAEDSDYVNRAAKHTKFRVLKSHKVPVSVRRLDRDGRFNILMKYVLCGLYMRIFGQVKTNIFNYTFGYDNKKKK